MITLEVERRQGAKNEVLRASGRMPAVFYGPKEAATAVSVDAKAFAKAWKQAGESSVIILRDEKGAEHEALIHDIDVHPVSGAARHADFYVIEKGKKVRVHTPIVFAGVSPAVKDKGGILVKVMRELEIEAAPRDLPHEISVDISPLTELNSAIHAKDVKLPTGVSLITRPEEIVASIAEAREEVEEAPQAIDMSAIEVEAKGKEVKEGEEGASDASKPKEAASKPAPAKKEDNK